MQRWKMFIPCFLALTAAMVVMVWDITDQNASINEQNRIGESERSTNMMRERVRIELKNLSAELAQVIRRELPNLNPDSELSAQIFLAVGLIKPTATGSWELEWSRHRDPSLSRSELMRQIGEMPPQSLSPNETHIVRTKNSNGKYHIAAIVPLNIKTGEESRQQLGIGYLSSYHFMDIATPFKGQSQEFLLVDEQGVALAHSDPQYIGAKFDRYPIVEDLLQKLKDGISAGIAITSDRRFVGSFDRVPDSNIFSVIKLPLGTTHSVFKLGTRAFLVVIAMSVLAGLALNWMNQRNINQLRVATAMIDRLQSPEPTPAEVVEKIGESRRAYAELAKPLALFVRGPLQIIRGHVQVVKHKLTDSSLREVIEKMEQESRKLCEFADDLAAETNLSAQQFEVCDLTVLLEQAISLYRGKWISTGVQIEENLRTDLQVKSDFNETKGAFKTLLGFIDQEIAKAKDGKKVVIETKRIGGMAETTIEFQGTSLEQDVRRHLFLPFKVRIENSPSGGLDLAICRVLVNSVGGDVSIESLGDNGFRFHLRLPTAISKEEITASQMTTVDTKSSAFPEKPLVEIPGSEAPEQLQATESTLELNLDETTEMDPGDMQFEVKIRKPKMRTET